MKPLSRNQVTGQVLGHLGLVAASIQELGLIHKIDTLLPVASEKGAKVTFGQRVAAMIMNGLGFTNERLYMFETYLADKPIDRLFGAEIQPYYFNDDALGRCLDAIAEYGVNKFFMEIAFSIGREKGLLGKTSRGDTTTLIVYGQYPAEREPAFQGAQPSFGHSKENLPYFKQMILYLATTGASNFPIAMEALSGNVADQKSLIEAAKRMEAFKKRLNIDQQMLHVGDSALYSGAVKEGQDFKWLTRVPESISQARNLLESEEVSWEQLEKGYRIAPYEKVYKGVLQRWIMVYSQQAYEREIRTLAKQIDKEYTEASKELAHLRTVEFGCEKDALQSIKSLKKLKYHTYSYDLAVSTKYVKRGRPCANSPVREIVKVVPKIERDEAAIKRIQNRKGRFILATNEMDRNKLSDRELLWEYKAQSGVERGFQFIKDATFEVDSIFLKKPSRINALMAVMCLCLMVYGYSEYMLRQALASQNESIPNQLNKPTKRPSMKWIYRLFASVHVVTIHTDKLRQRLVINLSALLERIISYFGVFALSVYGLA